MADSALNADERATLSFLRRGQRDRSSDELVKLLLPPNRKATAEGWDEARRQSKGWRVMKLKPTEVGQWLAAGVHPDECDIVDHLIGEGIEVRRAEDVIEHADTGEGLTIVEVMRRALGDPYSHVSDAMDRAGIVRQPGARPSRFWWQSG